MPRSGRSRVVVALRRAARPARRAIHALSRLRLAWIHQLEGIEGIESELRRMRPDTARVLRSYGATVADDAIVIGPISLINADRDLSNLSIGSKAHVGSEVFLDLVERVTIGDGATLSMRCSILTHLDVGHGPLAARRPRAAAPVTISAGAYVGVGATILHGVTVGREAIVGAGALVREDVPDGAVVVGVPARRV